MKTNFPVKYHMMGYNNLQGSHYDEYVVEYRSYKECIKILKRLYFYYFIYRSYSKQCI